MLYIPHGSDERDVKKITKGDEDCLYIPHGSDERGIKELMLLYLKNFISHMVQMKGNI